MLKNSYAHRKINVCAKCGYEMDRSTAMNDEIKKPKENDFAICLKCGALYKYNIDLTLRLLSQKEKEELALKHPEVFKKILLVLQAISLQKQERGKFFYN